MVELAVVLRVKQAGMAAFCNQVLDATPLLLELRQTAGSRKKTAESEHKYNVAQSLKVLQHATQNSKMLRYAAQRYDMLWSVLCTECPMKNTF